MLELRRRLEGGVNPAVRCTEYSDRTITDNFLGTPHVIQKKGPSDHAIQGPIYLQSPNARDGANTAFNQRPTPARALASIAYFFAGVTELASVY